MPCQCDEKFLIKMFEHIEGVIDVKIAERKQISDSMTNFTFEYATFNKEDKEYVEEYVKGIGWKIN